MKGHQTLRRFAAPFQQYHTVTILESQYRNDQNIKFVRRMPSLLLGRCFERETGMLLGPHDALVQRERFEAHQINLKA